MHLRQPHSPWALGVHYPWGRMRPMSSDHHLGTPGSPPGTEPPAHYESPPGTSPTGPDRRQSEPPSKSRSTSWRCRRPTSPSYPWSAPTPPRRRLTFIFTMADRFHPRGTHYMVDPAESGFSLAAASPCPKCCPPPQPVVASMHTVVGMPSAWHHVLIFRTVCCSPPYMPRLNLNDTERNANNGRSSCGNTCMPSTCRYPPC